MRLQSAAIARHFAATVPAKYTIGRNGTVSSRWIVQGLDRCLCFRDEKEEYYVLLHIIFTFSKMGIEQQNNHGDAYAVNKAASKRY